MAPILTYTIDELLEYAPAIIKDNAQDVFDLNYYELPEVESKLNEELLINAKEKFSEAIDTLKKIKPLKQHWNWFYIHQAKSYSKCVK